MTTSIPTKYKQSKFDRIFHPIHKHNIHEEFDTVKKNKREVENVIGINLKAAKKAGYVNPPSRTKNWFNWLINPFSNNFSTYKALPTRDYSNSTIKYIDTRVNANSTILLLDLISRKISGEKVSSRVKNDEPSMLEIQGFALNVISEFEDIQHKCATGSGLSEINIDFDPILAQTCIIPFLRNGQWSEVPVALYSYVKKANPDLRQNEEFFKCLKDHLKLF